MDSLTQRKKVIIADDHLSVREWLEVILNESPLFHVVESLRSGAELEAVVARLRPDLVITDIKMPDLSGDQAARALRTRYPDLAMVAYTGFVTEGLFLQLIKCGFNGIVVKRSPASELMRALEQVMNGEVGYCKTAQHTIKVLVEKHLYNDRKNTVKPLLNDRNLVIIRLIAEGNASAAIAEALGISIHSVNTYRKRLLDKTGCLSPAHLVHYAHQHGLIDDIEP
ncbi:MAG: response regulator transcription factor [Chitinophagaceae bacterium]|nr:MAG: response regulator transcription factor [Chitinophagaceae bacterium]